MSIANNSLLRRILVEVRDGPAAIGLEPPERTRRSGQLIELRRTRRVHQPPFATSLHFWAHALRAFLEECERPELFEALAANCLCEAAAGPRVAAAMSELGARLVPPVALEPRSAYLAGYRMIDQEVLVSWVAEAADEFVAIFWGDRSWLETALPLVLD